jgi:glycerol dehydrogenase-like iron-containing ADH family enzyme
MAERMSDEETLRAIPADVLAKMSEAQRAALEHALARLEASEKVAWLVKDSLSPKARAANKASGKHVYWFDVAAAIKRWEDLAQG